MSDKYFDVENACWKKRNKQPWFVKITFVAYLLLTIYLIFVTFACESIFIDSIIIIIMISLLFLAHKKMKKRSISSDNLNNAFNNNISHLNQVNLLLKEYKENSKNNSKDRNEIFHAFITITKVAGWLLSILIIPLTIFIIEKEFNNQPMDNEAIVSAFIAVISFSLFILIFLSLIFAIVILYVASLKPFIKDSLKSMFFKDCLLQYKYHLLNIKESKKR